MTLLGAWLPRTFFCIEVCGFEILKIGEKIDLNTQKHIQNPVKHLRWGVLRK